MGRRKNRKWAGLVLVLLLVVGSMSTVFHQFMAFPTEMRLFSGTKQQLRLTMPATATVSASKPGILEVNGTSRLPLRINLQHPLTVGSKHTGQTQLTLRLFGKLPLKRLRVQVLPDIRVIPGGQSIGVKLKSSGALVVGHHRVEGSTSSPAEEADIRIGDYIVRMNGEPIREISQVSNIIRTAGKNRQSIRVHLVRNGKLRQTLLHPVYDEREEEYRIGLYLRNSAAGVGTLTFFDPRNQVYGALGHVITDMDTGQPISVGGGKIVRSNVTSIQKGASGEPGEKRAIFFRENQVLGSIVHNTEFGIFGKMNQRPGGGLYDHTIPVALAEQVKEGPAQILTVVEGQKVERYDIEIVHLIHQKFPATKGMIIKVTDPRLLKKSGGIVQGMSGSPILQDGKLVGAVTHVFVNDPSSGYGTYIEWMLQDAGVLKSAGLDRGSAFFHVVKR